MALEITEAHSTVRGSSLQGAQSTFVVIFIAFLLMAMVALLLGQNWRSLLPGAEGEQSVLGGVRSAVYTVMSEFV
jgi:hypothetical protein